MALGYQVLVSSSAAPYSHSEGEMVLLVFPQSSQSSDCGNRALIFAFASVSMWREQASRGYEWLFPTLDVQAERFEPRDVLWFQNEFSDVVWVWSIKTLL